MQNLWGFFFSEIAEFFQRQQVSLEKYCSSLWLIINYHSKYKIIPVWESGHTTKLVFLLGSWIQVMHSNNKLPFSHHPHRITSKQIMVDHTIRHKTTFNLATYFKPHTHKLYGNLTQALHITALPYRTQEFVSWYWCSFSDCKWRRQQLLKLTVRNYSLDFSRQTLTGQRSGSEQDTVLHQSYLFWNKPSLGASFHQWSSTVTAS